MSYRLLGVLALLVVGSFAAIGWGLLTEPLVVEFEGVEIDTEEG